ncbi:MAG: hypothetical protein ABW031_05755, partial [Methyloceanibacter sp.]
CVKAEATLAINYIIRSQGRNGSWGYTGGQPIEGDTSIVGWQIQALHAAQLAFVHPGTGRLLKFNSELPSDLAEIVQAFKQV